MSGQLSVEELDAAAKALSGIPADQLDGALRAVKQRALVQRPVEEADPMPILRTLREYLEWEPPDAPRIVEPAVIVRGGITVTTGRGGKGKTSVALARILRWAVGRPLFDEMPEHHRPANGPVKTLIIENEGAPAEFHKKIGRLLTTAGFSDEEHEMALDNVVIWDEGGYSDLRVDDGDGMRKIRYALDKIKPDVLFLEPFSHIHEANENDNTEMRAISRSLQQLTKEFNIGLWVSHHERKAGVADGGDHMDAQRGASVFEGTAAYMERFLETPHDTRILVKSKRRYMPPEDFHGEESLEMKWREDNSGWYDYLTAGERAPHAMEALQERARQDGAEEYTTAAELASQASIAKEAMAAQLQTLKKAGLAESSGKGWRLSTQQQEGGLSF